MSDATVGQPSAPCGEHSRQESVLPAAGPGPCGFTVIKAKEANEPQATLTLHCSFLKTREAAGCGGAPVKDGATSPWGM